MNFPFHRPDTAVLLLLILAPIVPTSDEWTYPKELVETSFDFGANTIVRIVDARENTTLPDFLVKVLAKDGNLMALYRNVSFQEFAISPDKTRFVGVSNGGLPGTAFFVLNSNGGLEFELKHNYGRLQYCTRSITVIREWYDGENPDIQFEYKSYEGYEWLDAITINGCNGDRLNLMKLF